MNGLPDTKRVLDSNVVINFINKTIGILPGANNAEKPQYFVSVITEMEAHAKPNDTEEARKDVQALLSKFTIVPLNDEVKNLAIEIRRSGSPRPKKHTLPPCLLFYVVLNSYYDA